MMQHITPEAAGVSSVAIADFIRLLEEYRIPTHSLLLARGDKLFYEGYWAPFHRDFCHRMYSVSKSVVALGIGFLEQDGLVELDERIFTYFPAESAVQTDENMAQQTVRDMLSPLLYLPPSSILIR